MHQYYSDTSESSGALLLRVCSGRENTRARGKEDGIWQLTQDAGPVILVQSLSPVQLFVTPWTAAHQASLSFTISWSLLKSIPIELVILSNHLIPCCPLLLLPSIFPGIRVFSNESVLSSGGQNIGASASASVLPMTIQGWFPLEFIGWSPCSARTL